MSPEKESDIKFKYATLRILAKQELHCTCLQFYFMQVHSQLYPDVSIFEQSENRWNMFDKVNGTHQTRLQFSVDFQVEPLLKQWRTVATAFQDYSKQYWMYE